MMRVCLLNIFSVVVVAKIHHAFIIRHTSKLIAYRLRQTATTLLLDSSLTVWLAMNLQDCCYCSVDIRVSVGAIFFGVNPQSCLLTSWNNCLSLLTGTLKRRRAQQHANSQVQHQSQHPHAHQHGGHGGQRQPQRQPQRQAQPQRHHRQPRENYQMGQMRRWDPCIPPLFPPNALAPPCAYSGKQKASLHPKKSLTWLLVIIISSIYRQNRHVKKRKHYLATRLALCGVDSTISHFQCSAI